MTSCPSSLILPLSTSSTRGWKKAERKIEEIKPTKNNESTQQQDQTWPSSSSCQVCRDHEARYTCPRCQLRYCSIECYQIHNIRNDSNGNSVSTCTEEFYKQKVGALMKLESIESQDENHQMLQRYHRQQQQQQDDEEENFVEAWEQEELFQLLQKLEDIRDDDLKDMSPSRMEALLPLSLQRKFRRDIQEGHVQKLILKPWYPWWRRQLVGSDMEDNQEESPSQTETTLDERLLKVPTFKAKSKGNNHPILLFNLIDILYATCSTLRMYHGLQNIATNAPIEAAASLITASAVLSKDTRYSSLPEVLSQCTKQSAIHKERGKYMDEDARWSVVVEDVSHLMASHRLLGRALLEAGDVMKAAVKELKQGTRDYSKMPSKDTPSDHETAEEKEHIDRLRRLRKKIEFYLSWSQHTETKELLEQSHLKEKILAWRDDWISLGEDQNGIGRESNLDLKSMGLLLPP